MVSFPTIKSLLQSFIPSAAKPMLSFLPEEPSSGYQKSAPTKTPLQTLENRKPAAPQQAVPSTGANLATVQHRFDASDLYGSTGQPQSSDIQQDPIGDCYLLASLGSLADQQPEKVKNMIQYDSQTGNFTVTLYESDGKKVREKKVVVTQADLLDNITRRGGSKVDNNPGTDGPIWPAVIETAYAKLSDSNHADGLQQGYNTINSTAGGGSYPRDIMRTLTGKKGQDYKVVNSQQKILDQAYKTINKALHDGKVVTLWSIQEPNNSLQDGLVDNHVYTVKNIYRDSTGQIMVSLRNPWGHNVLAGEGTNTPNAELNVPLSVLVNSGGLEAFTIGKPPKH